MTFTLMLLLGIILSSTHPVEILCHVEGNGSPPHDHGGTQIESSPDQNVTSKQTPFTTGPLLERPIPSKNPINCQLRPKWKKSKSRPPLKERLRKWLQPGSSSSRQYHHEYASLKLDDGNLYTGTSTWMEIRRPYVEREEEMSLARIRIAAGNDVIEAGWEVYPECYDGSTKPHFYAYMTNDSYNKVNCLNAFCHDTFIRHSEDRLLGQPLDAAVIGGAGARRFELAIHMEDEGNWVLSVDSGKVGTWPARALPTLSRGATEIEWGGEVVTLPMPEEDGRRQPTGQTEMGSGQFAKAGFGKAAAFYYLQYRVLPSPPTVPRYQQLQSNQGTSHVTNANCYSLVRAHTGFLYGGPGHGPDCTHPTAEKKPAERQQT